MKLYLGTDAGLAVFEGRGENWRPRYLRLRERNVTAVATNDQNLLVGTTEGLWRSHDGGASLTPVRTGQSECHVRALAIHPQNPDLLMVGTEPASILYSRDGGINWVVAPDVVRLRDEQGWSLPYSAAAGCIRGFSLVGDRIYAAAEVGGVLRSDDAASTWRLLDGDVHPDVHEVAVNPVDPDTIYAATGGGRYRSRDGGQTWTLIGDGYTRAIWTDPERPRVVVAGPARYVGAMGRVERSIDEGDTWMLVSDGFKVPMSDMIERFVGARSRVVALTSDGVVYVARRGVWMWRALELGLSPVGAVAVGGV
jgi:photosystem II stability/assembly factor-like uncharacterized protein